eukprot:TRINITY_DN32933_c0_g1_i1.p1 TRINITY_DN32933_c0_g1~~TRINITY_DN32933_c0_g1_i1.p1  ORF type:complete len:214 (-),score=93.74 TRINITY_DN32933_c0_g1_i1:50-691(-)
MGLGSSQPPKPADAAPTLEHANQKIEKQVEDLEAKISKASEEAKTFVAQQATNPTAKARAMQALKRKKMYEQQRDQLVATQFNLENIAFQQEQAKITATAVDAMSAATEQLKNQKAGMSVDKVDRLTDEMQELAGEMKDIQSALASSSMAGADGVDADAEAELAAMYAQQSAKEEEEAMAILAKGGLAAPSAPAAVPAATSAAAKAAAVPLPQ